MNTRTHHYVRMYTYMLTTKSTIDRYFVKYSLYSIGIILQSGKQITICDRRIIKTSGLRNAVKNDYGELIMKNDRKIKS